MRALVVITTLSLAVVARASCANRQKAEAGLDALLVRNDQPTCPARRPAAQRQKVIQVEPELWNDYNERYTPNAEYTLPPSWNGPEHCYTEFCIYSTSSLGDGISLITTARNAYRAASFPVTPHTGIEPTAYYEAEVPGKGVGLIANRTIRKGEIIMRRLPVLLIQSTPHLNMEPEVREELYQTAVDMLPETTRGRFMRQMGDSLFSKVDRNSFRLMVDGDHELSPHLAVFPEVSRMNHDCRPNIHYRMNNLTITAVAVRDIPPGEELTVSYIYGPAVKSKRQGRLASWGFNCTCSQCSLSELESAASDARIRQIKALEEEIETKMKKSAMKRGKNLGPDEEVKPEMAAQLIDLYLSERLDAYLAPAYTRAALIYSMFANEEKAREYAHEAVQALEREWGVGAQDAESMRRLEKDPRAHWSWGLKATNGALKRNETSGR
ncbi:hypothetical protein VTK26DRAFT_9021 [Humicola hyalothermophila]